MNSTIPNELFRKSSYSQIQSQNCVEVADLPGASAVRDTQNRELGHLAFESGAWMQALAAVRALQA
jgi:hypothetical protein